MTDYLRAKENGYDRVLPFRFISAYRHTSSAVIRATLDQVVQEKARSLTQLPGRTVILVDVSGSMAAPLSGKSDMTRIDAACALAALFPGLKKVYSFSNKTVHVSPDPESIMGTIGNISGSQAHQSTMMGMAVKTVTAKDEFDRMIVITDEESSDHVGHAPVPGQSYIINVGTSKNGITSEGGWDKVSGFSENVFQYIAEKESA